jgi:hypothetical protein
VLLLAGAALALLFLAAACGGDGDGGDEKGVEATLRSLADAWNANDVDGLLALVTDAFIQDEIGAGSREEAAQGLQEFIGEPPIEVNSISNIAVSGETATAEIITTEGRLVRREQASLSKEGDQWRVEDFEDLGAEIPEGVTAVDVGMREYAFEFDGGAITNGSIAFSVTNAGSEQHVVEVLKVPEGLDVQEALLSEEDVGIEDLGGLDPLDPGSVSTVVFSQPLEPGRYALICWVEAADGQPHFLKGMVGGFAIE